MDYVFVCVFTYLRYTPKNLKFDSPFLRHLTSFGVEPLTHGM